MLCLYVHLAECICLHGICRMKPMPSSALRSSWTQCLLIPQCFSWDTWHRAKTLALERRWTAFQIISVRGSCVAKGSWQASDRKHGLPMKIWKQENVTELGVIPRRGVKSVGAKGALSLHRSQPSSDSGWEKQGWNSQRVEHIHIRANSLVVLPGSDDQHRNKGRHKFKLYLWVELWTSLHF